MLRFDWLKNLAKCYGQPEQAFARLGIGQKRRNLANAYQFNVIEQAKRWRIPKDLANPDFLANASSGECLVLTIKNRGLANPYILANAYSGELLRAQNFRFRRLLTSDFSDQGSGPIHDYRDYLETITFSIHNWN